ncbi:MAG: tetratricopeptide repeat protein, partial [Fimbriiglobus sp.]
KNGRAEVLKAMECYEDALKLYEQIARDHPRDVFAEVGRAEVLKAMERYEEALNLYEQIGRDHTTNVVAKNGRAEVLKAMECYEDALKLYEQTGRDHPRDVVAKNGRAEVLKAMERYEDALRLYEQIGRDHPANVVAKAGRLSTLLANGRASQVWEETITQKIVTRNDWITQHIRAMAAIRLNKFDEAQSILQFGVENCPLPSSRDYFSTTLAYLQLRQRKYEAARKTLLEARGEKFVVPRTLMLAHIAGEQNESGTAKQLLDGIVDVNTTRAKLIETELRIRFVDRGLAQHNDEWLFEQEFALLAMAA